MQIKRYAKAVPLHTMKAQEETKSSPSQTQAFDGGQWSASRPGRFIPRGNFDTNSPETKLSRDTDPALTFRCASNVAKQRLFNKNVSLRKKNCSPVKPYVT